jgi:hypothetical protein
MTATRRSTALLGRLRGSAGVHSQAAILAGLRRVFLEGGVPPGTPIPVDKVAETFGVSRIPVRESLRTLIGERLVDHRPNAGYLVAQLTVAEFQGLYTVRGILEKAARGAAVAHAERADTPCRAGGFTWHWSPRRGCARYWPCWSRPGTSPSRSNRCR